MRPVPETDADSSLYEGREVTDMGILVDIILIAAIGGYAFYLIHKIVSSMKAGKGNPYGCGDCHKCSSGCGCGCTREQNTRQSSAR